MTLNYFSVVYGVDAVLPGMLARGKRTHRGVASLGGYRPSTVALPYTRVEGGGHSLHRGSAAPGSQPRGIAVTVINPGFVRTPLTAHNAFKMPFLVEADDAAERIVRGLERGKDEVRVSGAAVVDGEAAADAAERALRADHQARGAASYSGSGVSERCLRRTIRDSSWFAGSPELCESAR